MRTRFIVLPLLAALLLLGACQDNKPAPTFGVVDMGRLATDSEPGKAAAKFFDDLQAQTASKLQELQKKAEENPDDTSINQLMQAVYVGGQQRLQREAENVNTVLLGSIIDAVKQYRAKSGLDAVLRVEAVLDSSAAVDVTSGVLDILNQAKVTFTPVTEEPNYEDLILPAAPEAAPEAPADAAPEAPAEAAPAAPAEAAPEAPAPAAPEAPAAN